MTMRTQIFFILIFLMNVLNSHAQISEGGAIIQLGDKKTIPIQIQSDSQRVKALADAAFSTHGGYRLVLGGDVSFVFDLNLESSGTLVLQILSGDPSRVQFKRSITGATVAGMVYKACDLAVVQTLGIPGYFSGEIAFVGEQSGHREIWLSDVLFNSPRRVTSDQSNSLNPSLSPDGNFLIYTGYFKTGFADLFKIDLRTGKRTVFANFNGTNMGGVFSPNGKWVASILSSTGNHELWLSTAERTSLRRLTNNDSSEASPTWSPDGKQIILTSDRPGAPRLHLMSVNGGKMQRIPTNISGYCAEPDWNPRHKNLVAFTAAVGGRFQIALYDFKKNHSAFLTELAGDCVEPCWTNDGRHLLFTRKEGGRKGLWILDTETKSAKPLHAASFRGASQADFILKQ